jgi:hypothetical protein
MIIQKIHLITKLQVWTPKYNDKSLTRPYGEPVALVHKNKLDFAASSVIIVEFPRAKHLQGQRFAIRKQDAQRHAVGSNGKAPMYEIPLSHFEPYETAAEVRDKAFAAFPD